MKRGREEKEMMGVGNRPRRRDEGPRRVARGKGRIKFVRWERMENDNRLYSKLNFVSPMV